MYPGRTVYLFLFFCFLCGSALAENYRTYTTASISDFTDKTEVEAAAVEMLREEIYKRTLIDLSGSNRQAALRLVVGTRKSLGSHREYDSLLSGSGSPKADGFTVKYHFEGNAPYILIAGDDSRGLLFGIGYVLRKARLSRNRIEIPQSLSLTTAPVVPLRGHQLGYRPKVNSYDGFTVDMWEQYIRDLVVFGTNAVELLPPFTDDASDSPMFTLPQKDMLVKMSGLAKKYGLDVWMWYPLMHGDYSKPGVAEKSLAENDSIFKSIPKLDAVFVPGGDPGRQTPYVFFKHIQRKLRVLRKYHPRAEIWMSPQGYSDEWMRQFISIMKANPDYLTGIVHGPWCRMDVDSLRKIVPPQYPIRRYPDITHTIDAQYYVPDWDFAYTVTQNREPINPRPVDQQTVFKSVKLENFKGFITYSEGVNDDVNKMVWSGLGWNPDADLTEILRDYSRYFISPDLTHEFAQGLLALEKNWRGPLLTNQAVYTHHAMFQEMERKAPPAVRLNWRFQQALYRSYYDAYTRSRLIYEKHLEDQALSVLRKAPETGSLSAMQKARDILAASDNRVSTDWRQRTFELAEALFNSIRMQLSVRKYFAIDTIRGGNLDLIDSPLNNRFWLEDHFDRIAKLKSESERLQEIDRILNWENPGPGGYYDDLGDPSNQPHIVLTGEYAKDPNSFHTAFAGLPGGYSLEIGRIHNWRTSWKTYMQTIYGVPLELRYDNLDPDAQYQVKVVYVEDVKIRLTANDGTLVHDYLMPDFHPKPVTFTIPREATRTGRLSLKWTIDANGDGPGRGCSVAEVWLVKK